MRYRMLLLPLTLGLLLQPALASDEGCWTKNRDTSIEKTSADYSSVAKTEQLLASNGDYQMRKRVSNNASTEEQMEMVKAILKKTSARNLQKYGAMLESLVRQTNMDHPNYGIIVEIHEYIQELINGPSESIVDLVVATPDVSILKDIVVALDLVDTLASDGPFTVFAPTNQAFEKLLADLGMTFDELAQQEELLKTVVLYHVLWSKVPAETVVWLTEGTLVETVGGESVRISNRNWVKIDDSNVIQTDIMASNGIIHLIDEVLLPPSVRETLGLTTDRGEENIVTTAIDSGEFPTLIAAVQAAWLVDTLADWWPFTIYAPTEEAFSNLLKELHITAEELLANTELLTKVLTYHVVPGFYTAEDIIWLTSPIQSPTAQWSTVTISPNNGSPMVNMSNIIATDIYASNGVIHVIDKVLMPE